jgi:cyanate permease
LPINATLLVNQWFMTRRGLAIAIMSLGLVLSTAVFPPLARFLIDHVGWREAYAWLGLLAMALVVPPALLFVRNRPEDIRLFPDGRPHPPLVETRQSKVGPDEDRRVLSSPAFWLLALPLATPGLISTALMFHQTSIFVESGLSPTLAAGVFVIYAASSAVTSMIAGFVIDRTGPKALFGFVMLMLLLVLLLGVATNSVFVAVLYIFFLGCAGGSHAVVQGVIWAHYYGRHRLGRVQGSATTIGICGTAIGPLLLALFHDVTGTYTAGMLAIMALPALSLLSITLAHPKSPTG